jgi:hypothetical protein
MANYVFVEKKSGLVGCTKYIGVSGWERLNTQTGNVLPFARLVTEGLVSSGNPWDPRDLGGTVNGGVVLGLPVAELWLGCDFSAAKSGEKIITLDGTEFGVRFVSSPKAVLKAVWGVLEIRRWREILRGIYAKKAEIDKMVSQAREFLARPENASKTPVELIEVNGCVRLLGVSDVFTQYGYPNRTWSEHTGAGPDVTSYLHLTSAPAEVLLAIYMMADCNKASKYFHPVYGENTFPARESFGWKFSIRYAKKCLAREKALRDQLITDDEYFDS